MNCKTKNTVKLILDILLIVLTLTLFNKSFISMKYHEITGLVVIGIMLVHIGINIKTAKAMCIKFAKLPAALKVGIITDLLLLLNFLWFGISGILCSKTILTSISSDSNIFKLYHMAAGAAALVLLGIHIGLHLCRKQIPKKLIVIMTVIFVAAGAYSILNSSFIRWVSIPFSALQSQQSAQTEIQHGASSRDSIDADNPGRGDENIRARNEEELQSGNGENLRERGESEKPGGASHKNGNGGSSVADKAKDIAMYFSIIAVFSILTFLAAAPKKKNTPCSNS